MIKTCPHNFLVGLKLCQVRGLDEKTKNHILGFIFFLSYLKLPSNFTHHERPFAKNSQFMILLGLFSFIEISSINLKLINFFLCHKF